MHELHERGVLVLIDGAHAPGQLPLALDELGADFYTGNCHKWMCAPKSVALLHVAREHRDWVRPTVISHGANSARADRSRYWLEFDWVGTNDPTAVLSVPATIRVLGGLFPDGWDGLRRRNHALALAARDRLADALGADAPAPDEMLGSMATLPLPGGLGDGAAEPLGVDPFQLELFEQHRIEVPVIAWPALGQRMIRVSAQAYNELAEYEALADALRPLTVTA